MIRYALHRLAHRLKLNHGRVVVWHDNNRRLMVGFRCVCGELQGVHPARYLSPTSRPWRTTE